MECTTRYFVEARRAGRPNVSPARKGWGIGRDDASAVGAALRSDVELCRSATQSGFAISLARSFGEIREKSGQAEMTLKKKRGRDPQGKASCGIVSCRQ